ncbi:MAG: cysteine desulfurase family protein [archaeon]|nr:cysteine desulfurase family protein [archaeon]
MIYLDYASTTSVRKEVLDVMLPFFTERFGNPSSKHDLGLDAKEAITKSKEKISSLLGLKDFKIIFTSGGTESVNLALTGTARALKDKGKHIITTSVEHKSVLNTCKFLEGEGFEVTYLPADKFGLINLDDLEKSIRDDTILISIIYANNEIGTIQPMKEVSEIAKRNKILFHTDACQAAGLDFLDMFDLITLNGSKIYGPKGIGILAVRSEVSLHPLIHGGAQEFGKRAGTENVPGIVGFTKALELYRNEFGREDVRLRELQNYFKSEIISRIPGVTLNGHPEQRLPNNINLSFADVEGEKVLDYLNERKIYASSGSACNAGIIGVSHVLEAIEAENQNGTIRFSFGKETTKEQLVIVILALQEIVESLRKIS